MQLAELLSKLVRMLAEINGVIAKRAPVMSLTEELQEARAESDWLREYDNDENRQVQSTALAGATSGGWRILSHVLSNAVFGTGCGLLSGLLEGMVVMVPVQGGDV